MRPQLSVAMMKPHYEARKSFRKPRKKPEVKIVQQVNTTDWIPLTDGALQTDGHRKSTGITNQQITQADGHHSYERHRSCII